MNDKPLVTILTPTRNSESTIGHAIESVLHQTYPNIEYLILDNLSEDRTLEIARSYQQAFEDRGCHFRILTGEDRGLYDALNKGARQTQGELIGQINSDDWYEPEAVETMVQLYEKESYDIAWASVRIHTPKGSFIKKARVGRIWTTAHFCHPTMFSRRQVLLQFPYAVQALDDDFDLVLRVHNAGRKIVSSDRVLANYTFGGLSTTKSMRDAMTRARMKYRTYQRNGYSRFYLLYCVAVELTKYLFA